MLAWPVRRVYFISYSFFSRVSGFPRRFIVCNCRSYRSTSPDVVTLNQAERVLRCTAGLRKNVVWSFQCCQPGLRTTIDTNRQSYRLRRQRENGAILSVETLKQPSSIFQRKNCDILKLSCEFFTLFLAIKSLGPSTFEQFYSILSYFISVKSRSIVSKFYLNLSQLFVR